MKPSIAQTSFGPITIERFVFTHDVIIEQSSQRDNRLLEAETMPGGYTPQKRTFRTFRAPTW